MNHDDFDWDFENISHIALHGITPEEAEDAYNGPLLFLELQDQFGETRFSEVGRTPSGRVLQLVTTVRHSRVRMITAYHPDRKTLARYYAEFGES